MKFGYPSSKQMGVYHRVKACDNLIYEESKKKKNTDEETDWKYELSYEANSKNKSIANCLELRKNKKFGRHLITNRVLYPGDVIVIEDFFVHTVERDIMKMQTQKSATYHDDNKIYYSFCAYCFNSNSLDLIPCDGCTHTMYCSEECKKKAYKEYHQYECSFFDLNIDMPILVLRTFYRALSICHGDINELERLIESIKGKDSLTVFDFDMVNASDNEIQKNQLLSLYCGLKNNNKQEKLIKSFEQLLRMNPMLDDMMETHDEFIINFVTRIFQVVSVGVHVISKVLPNSSFSHQIFAGMIFEI